MRLSFLKTGLVVVAVATLVGAMVYAQGQGQQTPLPGRQGGRGGSPQNLQILPKDWTLQQVQQTMRGFAAALGVECTHCHVGTMAERSKDDNPKKAIARKMLQMTITINDDLLKDVGEVASPGTSKVTCFTCHRGSLKPLNAPAGGGH